MEKSVDHYMSLPYTVELERGLAGFRASVKELRGCSATAKASEGVEERWRRLKDAQRRRIEELLEFGEEVPEPAGASIDPFWKTIPDGLGEREVGMMLYRDGATFFPVSVLAELWTQELAGVGLAEVALTGTPIKGGIHHLDQPPQAREGDLRPVRLGKGGKVAWVRFDGPRTARGYRDVDLLDQPLRTDAAVVAALTVLEASVVRDADFERLRKGLREHLEAHPELRGYSLHDVLSLLPTRWYSAQKAAIDQETKELTAEERKKRLGQSWERWERSPRLWRRSLNYLAALLRHHRPDFEARPLEEKLKLLDRHRKHVNAFFVEQRKHAAFLEYGTAKGLPKAVQGARDQVKAAVLADVDKLRHIDIADELGLDIPRETRDRYKGDMKIPQVNDLVRDGRLLLDRVLDEAGWQAKAEEMRAEAARYKALSKEEKEIVMLAENTGRAVEEVRELYQTNPELARFLGTPLGP